MVFILPEKADSVPNNKNRFRIIDLLFFAEHLTHTVSRGNNLSDIIASRCPSMGLGNDPRGKAV
jgi:hypothetical protein